MATLASGPWPPWLRLQQQKKDVVLEELYRLYKIGEEQEQDPLCHPAFACKHPPNLLLEQTIEYFSKKYMPEIRSGQLKLTTMVDVYYYGYSQHRKSLGDSRGLVIWNIFPLQDPRLLSESNTREFLSNRFICYILENQESQKRSWAALPSNRQAAQGVVVHRVAKRPCFAHIGVQAPEFEAVVHPSGLSAHGASSPDMLGHYYAPEFPRNPANAMHFIQPHNLRPEVGTKQTSPNPVAVSVSTKCDSKPAGLPTPGLTQPAPQLAAPSESGSTQPSLEPAAQPEQFFVQPALEPHPSHAHRTNPLPSIVQPFHPFQPSHEPMPSENDEPLLGTHGQDSDLLDFLVDN